MKLAMAAAEAVPFAKTGGLADVIGALPQALARLPDVQVCVFLPYHKIIPVSYTHLDVYKRQLYDTCVFEFTDPQARKMLNHIQAEEQQHGEKMYTYMSNNNMMTN